MTKEWPDNELKVCRFARAHYQPWANAQLKDLFTYFKWHAIMNLLGIVMHERKVMAVATVRFFHHLEDYREDFKHDPAGRYIRANLYGALCPQAIVVLGGRLPRIHDIRGCTFLWHRDPEELGSPRQYSVTQFTRLMWRLLYVQRKRTYSTVTDAISAS